MIEVSDSVRAALAELVVVYASRRPHWNDTEAGTDTGAHAGADSGEDRADDAHAGSGAEADVGTARGPALDRSAPGPSVRVLDAEVLDPGRPGIVDVVAELDDRVVHVPFGLRSPGEDTHFIPDGEDAVLGFLADAGGEALVFDATRDATVAARLLERVSGEVVSPTLVRHLRDDGGSVTLAMDDRVAFTVFNDVVDGPRPDLELFLALDDVGFNHLAAPLAVWRRAGRDLGVAQEYLAGASSGYALALTSVRDLYASGGPPELAGGDFGAEAHRIGTMTARMHIGLDKAFGRRLGDVGQWAGGIEDALRPLSPHVLERPDVEELLARAACAAVPVAGHPHPRRPEPGTNVSDRAGLVRGRLRHRGQPSVHGGRRGRARRRRPSLPVACSPTWPTCSGLSITWRRRRPTNATRPGATASASSPTRGWRATAVLCWPAISVCPASAGSSRPGARRCAS